MKRLTGRIAIAAALLGLGWSVGRAQTSQPDFELIVNAPVGETTVQCSRNCQLVWVERGINPDAKPQPDFKFACSGQQARCSSARIGGWATKP